MTNKLEKQFFDTFGIEPKYNDCCMIADKYWANEELSKYITFDDFLNCECPHINEGCFSTCEYAYDKIEYPQITDHILLELICLLNNHGKNDTWAVSVENLKDCILMNCIKVIKEKDLKEMSLNNFKHKVRTLFEEVENEN